MKFLYSLDLNYVGISLHLIRQLVNQIVESLLGTFRFLYNVSSIVFLTSVANKWYFSKSKLVSLSTSKLLLMKYVVILFQFVLLKSKSWGGISIINSCSPLSLIINRISSKYCSVVRVCFVAGFFHHSSINFWSIPLISIARTSLGNWWFCILEMKVIHSSESNLSLKRKVSSSSRGLRYLSGWSFDSSMNFLTYSKGAFL